MTFVAATPEVRAAVFATIGPPAVEHRRLSTVARGDVGTMLGARTPSLLNTEYGLTAIDGVPVPAPLFNENQPLQRAAAGQHGPGSARHPGSSGAVRVGGQKRRSRGRCAADMSPSTRRATATSSLDSVRAR